MIFVVFISLIGFVVILTIQIIKRKNLGMVIYILLFIFTCGLYLFVPSRYAYLGFATQQPNLIKKAIKLSINPYEKRLCNKYLSEIYASDMFNQGIKDGNKAIAYMEKALNGEYAKYKSIKGDYQKTLELCNILKIEKGLPLINIYILNDEYAKALTAFKDNKSSENSLKAEPNKKIGNIKEAHIAHNITKQSYNSQFLKAELYKKIGNFEEALNAENIAKQAYNSQMKTIKEKSKQIEFEEQISKYKTIEAYKNWLEAQAKELKFK